MRLQLLDVAERTLRAALIGGVRAYRLLLSPWLGSSCRFTPTCSAYALQALQDHGAWCGLRLSGWRVLRCHPWCDGGHDPVPPASAGALRALAGATPSHESDVRKSPV